MAAFAGQLLVEDAGYSLLGSRYSGLARRWTQVFGQDLPACICFYQYRRASAGTGGRLAPNEAAPVKGVDRHCIRLSLH